MTAAIAERAAIAAPAGSTGMDVWQDRVRLRARRQALWIRAAAERFESPAGNHAAILHAEVERILEEPRDATAERVLFYSTDPEARILSERIRAADRAFFAAASCQTLHLDFDLSRLELDMLNLAVAAEIDPTLRRAYAYLNDDAEAAYPTQWLAMQLFEHDLGDRMGPDCPLVEWRMAHPYEDVRNPWGIDAPWAADATIVQWLMGRDGADPVLGSAVELADLEGWHGGLCVYPEQLRGMIDFAAELAAGNRTARRRTVAIELVGSRRSGRRTLAMQFASALKMRLICADAEALLNNDVPFAPASERAMRVMRMAKLNRALVYWSNSERAQPRIWGVIERDSGLVLLGSAEMNAGASASMATRPFQLPHLKREMRLALWKKLSDLEPPPAIAECQLTVGEIGRAAQVAPAGADAVAEICRHYQRPPSAELFTPLPCPFAWDDIVLTENLRKHLMELEQQVRLRRQVYEEWGFERLCPLGRGITALFAGASGTGKTMAAQVLARSLDLILYRVDLAGVVNKYIGETEKRLKQVFDSCERANVLLFFDEADALFGQRTQVKDAHDRFANIEIDYLLQRMEQFEGIAVLATNRKGDLDKAFLRRIRFIVDFQPPGPAERLTLWRRALTARSPAGEELLDGIDWELLSSNLVMTGAAITSAALGAAFLARADGRRIAMSHVLHAARREMNKQAVAVRPGEWER